MSAGRALPRVCTSIAAATVLASLAGGEPAAQSSAVDQAFASYWAATTPAEAATASAGIVRAGVAFDAALARLKTGRVYRTDVARGVQKLVRRAGAIEFPYTIDVPASYDPGKRYQVRVQLHGGVGRPTPIERGDGSIGALAGAEQIYVLPQAWAEASWWAPPQDENLPAILDAVKRTYNVDENRVVLAGVSDGGTGAFYVAMRDTTPYASFLPLNGFIMVLRNGDLGLTGSLYPQNLRNKPLFAVNGGKDPLYPAALATPFMTHFAASGMTVDYRPQPEAGHNTAWWPTVKEDFERFVREHPRDPHPVSVTWTTDSTSAHNRAHWLVIDRLAKAQPAPPLPDVNDMVIGEEVGFGARTNGMRVAHVVTGSNAQAFGLQPGDLVERVNGRELPAGVDLGEFLGIYRPGDAVTLGVDRAGASVELRGSYAPTTMPRVATMFLSPAPSGRVDLVRDGNTIRATTRGVGAFTLLLSPDVIDFAAPVTVIADGKTVFTGPVKEDLQTLLTWSARDNDRTMLYGAALQISLDR